MVWTIAIILALLWVLGLTNSFTAGGYVHLLIAAAVVLVGYAIFRRQRQRRVS